MSHRFGATAGRIAANVLFASMLLGSCLSQTVAAQGDVSKYNQAAVAAEAWMRSHELRTETGLTWPVAPEVSADSSTGLYHGSCGAVLFLLALHQSAKDEVGDSRYLHDARLAADELIERLPPADQQNLDCGLYTGLAGIGFALQQVAEVSGEQKYEDAARNCLQIIMQRAQAVAGPDSKTRDNAVRERNASVRWNDSTDIISGSAGIGLYLLDAAQVLDDEAALRLATRAGDGLLRQAEQSPAGLSWKMSPGYPRDMPNFSHGTAGVAYFLCRLSQQCGEKRFLDAAIAGANHLQSIAHREQGGLCIYHHVPDGADLYYLGWCHGPPGTARLFYALGTATGDEHWHDLVRAAAKSVMDSGLPETRSAGFWNNHGICCGDAGVAEFFLELSLAYDRPEYRKFAKRVADHTMANAQQQGDGENLRFSWRHAEHRAQPENLSAQTGYMQGTAGIGMMLLRMDAVLEGKTQPARLPDSPFGSN